MPMQTSQGLKNKESYFLFYFEPELVGVVMDMILTWCLYDHASLLQCYKQPTRCNNNGLL